MKSPNLIVKCLISAFLVLHGATQSFAAEADIRLRAKQTLEKLWEIEKSFMFAIKANDVDAIRYDLNLALIALLRDRPDYRTYIVDTPQYGPCFDAADYLRNVADLTVLEPTADRLEARAKYMETYTAYMASCEEALGK